MPDAPSYDPKCSLMPTHSDKWMLSAFCGMMLALAALFTPCASAAAPKAENIYAFASHSYKKGDFLTSAIEFKRFVYFFPDDPRAPSAAHQVGMSYYRMQRYGDASSAFEQTIDQYPDSAIAIDSRFMLSRCHVRMGDPENGIYELRILLRQELSPDIHDRAYYQMGWIQLESGHIGAARETFQRIREESRGHLNVDAIIRGIDEPGDVAYKSPEVTGFLSIFPGAGYLYCGRYKDAAMAFFINGVLGVATYESVDNDLYALGGIIGLVNLGFYGGSIWGSISSAHKYNKRSYDEYIKTLKQDINPDLSLGVTRNSVLLTFQMKF